MIDKPNLTETMIDTAINDGAPLPEADIMAEPSYRVYADSKVAVSKHHGAVWKSRKDQIIARRTDTGIDAMFDEVLRYYRNDQVVSSDKKPLNDFYARRKKMSLDLSSQLTETENIVFANVSALVPTLYAKNPDAEITPNRADDEQLVKLAETSERLLDVLAAKKDAPGLALRTKIKRSVVHLALYNISWAEVGYTEREASNEQALNDIQDITKQLASAKSGREIKELEGKLLALEEKVDLLNPAGPYVKIRDPRDVLVDPDAIEPDASDAKYIITRELISTDYLNACYGKSGQDGEIVSVYEPSHVMKASPNKADNTDSVQDAINSFSLFSHEAAGQYTNYGYEDDVSFRRGCRTLCYKIYDKVTRRVYLYADNNWKYPIWVWDDPYQLPNFYNLVPAAWYIDPNEFYAKSEVAYYLDQQDAINDMNSELKRMRDWARGKIVYNLNVFKDPTAIEAFVNGSKKMLGAKFDQASDIKSFIAPLTAPSTDYTKLFDSQRQLAAIDRLSSVTAVQRGVEYKTNTTNKAIESYESQMQTRADEKMDSIEEFIGEILYIVLLMCFRFMPAETVAELIGDQHASIWRNMEPYEARALFSAEVVGGSSLKPTSSAKKQQAMNLAQTLGQFARATPVAGVVALRLIERAFKDDVVITQQDWDQINQSLQQGNGGEDLVAKLEQAVDSMPPEAKQALGSAIAQGVPIKQAIGTLMQKMQQQPGSAQTQPER